MKRHVQSSFSNQLTKILQVPHTEIPQSLSCKKPAKAPAKRLIQKSIKNLAKLPIQRPAKAPAKRLVQKSAKNLAKLPVQNPYKILAKNPGLFHEE